MVSEKMGTARPGKWAPEMKWPLTVLLVSSAPLSSEPGRLTHVRDVGATSAAIY